MSKLVAYDVKIGDRSHFGLIRVSNDATDSEIKSAIFNNISDISVGYEIVPEEDILKTTEDNNRDKLINALNDTLKEHFDYVPLEKVIKVADDLLATDLIKQ